MKIWKGGRSISLSPKRLGLIGRGVGLMFRTSGTSILLFDFKRNVTWSLTGLFVFFPFLVIWLDEKNKVIRSEIVRPFRVSIPAPATYRRIVEIPLHEKNRKVVTFFVGKRGKI